MGIFKKLLSKKPQEIMPAQTNSLGEDLTHLDADGELPWGWIAHNKEVVTWIERELDAFRTIINSARTPNEKHGALKSYLLYLENGKKRFSEMGECEGKYFQEYIIDSQESITNRERFERLERELNGDMKKGGC